jgi:hypothetical protein
MRYRKLDANGDMVFGRQQADFWRDVPDAPAQAVWTRLQLYLGDWFLDTSDGTPWRTQVLGKYTGSTRDPAIQARTLGTQNVTAIHAYASQVNRDTRVFNVQMTIDTLYGQANVSVQLREPT